MLHRCIDARITSQLLDSDHCATFLKLRVTRRSKRKTDPHQNILNLDHQKLSNPEVRKNLCKEVMRNINCNPDSSYSDVYNAVIKASSVVRPERGKAQTGWFLAEESCLLVLIGNEVIRNNFNRWTRQSTTRKNS